MRHLVPPRTLAEWLHRHRFTLARRFVQLGILLLMVGTARWGWAVAGRPLLAGNLSASDLLAAIPLADPFAVLQMAAAGRVVATTALVGAAIVFVSYAVIGGRSFCAWVCPVNVVADTAVWLRRRLAIPDLFQLSRRTRFWVLGLALLVSALTGVAAFEWVSPVAILHREIVFGAGLGLAAVAGLFLFDLAVLRHGWCGHLCPLGAFWSLFGRAAQLRVAFDAATCTRCGDCVRDCPEPWVLHFPAAERRGMVAAGACTNCGRCIAVCPERSLQFALRARIRGQPAVGAPTPTLTREDPP